MSQETVNQLKFSARNLGRELQALGYQDISHTHLLQALSRATGFESWNAMRAAATAMPAIDVRPATPARPYPQTYVSAVYHANGCKVEVVRWEDPVIGLGDYFYAYDADTFQCLTPTKDLAFSAHEEVPDYEAIVTLLDELEQSCQCPKCGHFSNAYEDEALSEGEPCPKQGCDGEMVPFFKN